MQIVEYQRPIFAIFKLHDFFIILLGITASTQQFTVAWPAWATNYVLESTTNLSTQDWVTNVGAITIGGTNFYYGTNPAGDLFFRLKR
jgi:hypothetical protein